MCRGGQGASAHTGGGGPPLPAFFREKALALSPRSTFKPLGGVEVERFFRRGAPLPFFRPRGAAAVLLSFF